MILEKNVKEVVETIKNYYKNQELACYSINTYDGCVDIALYDDIRKSEAFGRYFESKNFRHTEITIPNVTDKQLNRIKNLLEKEKIKENELYEPQINTTIFNIGDVVLYDNYSYGKIIDIDRNDMGKEETYPYAVVFPDIYLEDRPFWTDSTEIKPVMDKEKIKEIDDWYVDNKANIERDIKELQEEMESDY